MSELTPDETFKALVETIKRQVEHPLYQRITQLESEVARLQARVRRAEWEANELLKTLRGRATQKTNEGDSCRARESASESPSESW